MRNQEQLKEMLTQISVQDYNVPNGVDMDGLISDMLIHLGDADGELRDDLIYSIFGEWTDAELLSSAQMKHILDTCLSDNYLFNGIGKADTDTVFTRSFSTLAIALAFCLQDEKPFLTAKEVGNIQAILMRYAAQEKDYRGYVKGNGWAHAIAHLADALANAFGVDKVVGGDYAPSVTDLHKGLATIKMLICNKDFVYVAEEDERLVGTFFSICSSELLTTVDIIAWVDSFDMGNKEREIYPDDYNLRVNKKNFMRSLYFQLLECADGEFDEIAVREVDKHILGFLVEHEDD